MTTTYLKAEYISSRSQNTEEQAQEHIRKKDGDLAKLKHTSCMRDYAIWLLVINILKDFINIVHMFQPPLLLKGHRFLNLCLIFYVQNL